MNKKLIVGMMTSAVVASLAALATGAVGVHADTTTTDPANTKATLQVNAGTLSFTTPADQSFAATGVQTVYTDGYNKTVADATGTTVSDFLGDNQDWTLTVASPAGWSDAAMNNNNAAKLTVAADTADAVTISDQPAAVTTGNAGEKKVVLNYSLNIAKTTLLGAGQATNTLNWSLSNVPSSSTK